MPTTHQRAHAGWSHSNPEWANKDLFLSELRDILGVARPDAATGDPDRDRYVFERDAILIHGGEKRTIGRIDLYKHGCFLLEAKQGSDHESKKLGTARRGTPGWNIAMQEAFGQTLGYATTRPRRPTRRRRAGACARRRGDSAPKARLRA